MKKGLKLMLQSYKGLILAVLAALLFIYSTNGEQTTDALNQIVELDVDWTDPKNFGPPLLMILFGLVVKDADAGLPKWIPGWIEKLLSPKEDVK